MPQVFIRNYLVFTAILLVCAVSLGFLLIMGDKKIEKSDAWIFRTHEVIIESERLNTLVAQMVAAQRGFLITGDESHMEDYEARKAAASNHIANLSELTAGNPSQQSRLEEIRQYFSNLSMQLEDRIIEGVSNTSQQTLNDVETVKRLKADIFRINAAFLEEEYGLLNGQIKLVERRKDQYFLSLLVGGSVAITMLMIFNAYLLRVQAKRSAAEMALSESEEVFRLAVEGTQDGVFDWNIKTNKVFYSEQFTSMLGYEAEDFEGNYKDFVTRLHPDDKEPVEEYIKLYMDGQLSEYSNTFRMQHKSGRWVWINARAKMILDKSGKPVRMVGAHTDVTASKDYEQRLEDAKTKAEEANRAKSDFLAHMSHEIRTPLTTINGVAEILAQTEDKLETKERDLVRVLNASAVTLKDLVSDVLDFSKIESGELELEETSFDLEDAFEHIVSIMSVKTNEKNLDFKFDYDAVKNVGFYGDPVRLRQILINLIGNAVKFTPKGFVHVKASQGEKEGVRILTLEVKDSGIGVAPEHHEAIFERFKQADSSVSRKFGGTGLGLPISQKLAHLMGGDIRMESAEGKGSTFTLMLPFRENIKIADHSDQDEIKKSKINDKLKAVITDTDKILLVEDYEGNIVVLGYVLEDMGIEFDVARTGLEALNLWKENHYDLILMDIQMPEMDGFTATKQIRNIEEEQNLKRTPIVGMTAHALIGDKDKCIECGMDAYLPKPIVEVDLKSAILKFLKQKQKAA